MLEIRAVVYFNEPITHYINETQRKRNVILMDLFHFYIRNRGRLKEQYDFKAVDIRDHMINDYCDISGEAFLALVGKTLQEAEEKDVSYPEISVYDVVTFYNELAINTIDKVTLVIIELW